MHIRNMFPPATLNTYSKIQPLLVMDPINRNPFLPKSFCLFFWQMSNWIHLKPVIANKVGQPVKHETITGTKDCMEFTLFFLVIATNHANALLDQLSPIPKAYSLHQWIIWVLGFDIPETMSNPEVPLT